MKKVVTFLKNIRPFKLLTTFLAGMILFFTQACNSVTATTPSQTAPRQTVPRQIIGEEQSAPPNSEVYVPKGTNVLSPVEGGMNNFSDVDPRDQGANVKAKAEALKQNAEQNVIDETSNIGENTRRILDKKGENVEDLGKNLQQNAQETADKAGSSATDFARGAKKGIENIQENTSNAAKGLVKNAQGAAEDAKDNAQSTAENAGNAVNRTVKEATNEKGKERDKVSAGDTATNLAQTGQGAIENAGDFVQKNANQLVTSAQENLEKAGNAIKDAID
ncbi:hypothetical protein [Mastigocladopsis repens]|uniref:hypothetical protein n=1 Tax=Mastigocladopsis repens TaxID=221287 RepID=UPI0002FD5933|nr:hypothetical protein [Mastigocladopsis repens]